MHAIQSNTHLHTHTHSPRDTAQAKSKSRRSSALLPKGLPWDKRANGLAEGPPKTGTRRASMPETTGVLCVCVVCVC